MPKCQNNQIHPVLLQVHPLFISLSLLSGIWVSPLLVCFKWSPAKNLQSSYLTLPQMWVHTPFWLWVLLQIIYSSMISYPVWNVSFFLFLSNTKFFTIIFSNFLGSPTLIPAQAENKKALPYTYRRAIKPLYNLGRVHAKKPSQQMGGQQNTIFKELHFIPVRYSSTETRKSGSCLPQTLGAL